MITKGDIEKKVRALFRGSDSLDVKVEEKRIRVSFSGVGESPGDLLTKIGDFVSALSRVEGLNNVDVIVSMEGSAYGVEIELY